jgi:hypothetical protein
MSGTEVASIVLAVFVAPVQGAGGYNEVVAGRDVNLLVKSLNENKAMFSKCIGYFLRSVSPIEKRTRLLDDPRRNQWRHGDLGESVYA